MAVQDHPSPAGELVDPAAVRRKVYWRIIPLIFLLYIVAYLDRVNAGFAKLRMQQDLGFGDDVFGWGFGVFFIGYLVLEIPGTLLVEHWSARKWFARILFTWGLCSMATALVRTPGQFYLARFLLGLAEAGFFPGVIVYFTHWFPRAERGRAMAGLVLGVPLSGALGAPVSGWLLGVHWLGMPGWQWVFLAEGLPAVLLAGVVLYALADRPRHARWLAPAERDWLEGTLDAERREIALAGGVSLRQVLRRPTVWLLALGIFATNTGGYALGFWLPTTVKNFLAASDPHVADATVLNWMLVFYLCGLAGVWFAGQAGDRSGAHKWLCAAAMALAGVFLAATAAPGQPWYWVFGCLCVCGFFAYFWPPPFWVLPTLSLSASAAAVSIGFVNMCANFAGFVGPLVAGELKAHGFDDRAYLRLAAGCFVLGGVFIALLPVPGKGARDRK